MWIFLLLCCAGRALGQAASITAEFFIDIPSGAKDECRAIRSCQECLESSYECGVCDLQDIGKYFFAPGALTDEQRAHFRDYEIADNFVCGASTVTCSIVQMLFDPMVKVGQIKIPNYKTLIINGCGAAQTLPIALYAFLLSLLVVAF